MVVAVVPVRGETTALDSVVLLGGGGRHGRREGGQQEHGRGDSPDPRPRLAGPLSSVPDQQAQPPGHGRSPDAEVEDVRAWSGGQWYVGPGGPSRQVAGRRSGASCHRGLAGAVRSGRGLVRPSARDDPEWSLARDRRRPQHGRHADHLRSRPGPSTRAPSSAGRCSGRRCVAVGLGVRLPCHRDTAGVASRPARGAGTVAARRGACSSGRSPWSPGRACRSPGRTAWRRHLATVRTGVGARPPVTRMQSPACPTTSSSSTDIKPDDGRPIPELVVGPFGVAIVHELAAREIDPAGREWLGEADATGLDPDRISRSIASTATRNASGIG